MKHAPNPFNMQQSRAILVTGEHHHKLWEMVKETYKKTHGGDSELSDKEFELGCH